MQHHHDHWVPSDMCHGKKSRSNILKVPHQVNNSGSSPVRQGLPRQVYISGSWVPWQSDMSSIHFEDPGFPGSHVQYTFRDPSVRQGPTFRYYIHRTPEVPKVPVASIIFQDPESSRSHNLESPKSHKYTFQDHRNPQDLHDK